MPLYTSTIVFEAEDIDAAREAHDDGALDQHTDIIQDTLEDEEGNTL